MTSASDGGEATDGTRMAEDGKDDAALGRVPEAGEAGQLQARTEKLRMLEALLFAAAEPLDVRTLQTYFDATDDVAALLVALQDDYEGRGVEVRRVGGRWSLRTAEDLSFLLERHRREERKLSRAALETLAIIAYHQPVTRAEIEAVRGVQVSKGTIDVLMESGWIRLRGRRRAPGRPVTFGTSDGFLRHFGFDSIGDLPGLSDLKAAGLLDGNLPPGFTVPDPRDLAALQQDELPLDAEVEDEEPVADEATDAEEQA